MKNKSLLFKEFINEGIFKNISDNQMDKSIRHYSKLAHLADLLLKDINPIAKVEKNKIAKKIIFTSIKHVNFFKQTNMRLAKITKNFLNLNPKTVIDSNNFLIEVKKLKDQRAKSYKVYVRDIAEYRKDSIGEDDLVKEVLKLYNKINTNI